jgi:hypothetical protein
MKLAPLAAFAFLTTVALADSPTGFADIPFGAPMKEAQKTITAREGLKPEEATPDRLTFTGGTFSGQPVSRWTFTFAAGKFATGSVLIDKAKKPVYDDLKAQLTKKYGKPDSEKGHHSFDTIWEFRSDGRRTIHLQYEHQGRVSVTYSHGGLASGSKPGKASDL